MMGCFELQTILQMAAVPQFLGRNDDQGSAGPLLLRQQSHSSANLAQFPQVCRITRLVFHSDNHF